MIALKSEYMPRFCFMLMGCWMGIFLPLITSAQSEEKFSSDLQTTQKPWTNLDFQDDPQDFQFAIVTDRTGGPRSGIFEDAVMKLNWLMPEFVISVGDLIRGAKGDDSVRLAQQWDAHFERIAPLKMPFFHLAGNHDIKANNDFQVQYWNKLFGAPYYFFVYKKVLFICLFTNEGTQVLSDEQVEYFQRILDEHEDVRWTMVFMHHPLWRYPHMSNFEQIEASLANRPYTVYAGHQHHYHHSQQHEANYYVLATTGGGSPLLGNSFGSFDHITWVTMTDDGPVMANLRLDGILPHDVANAETEQLTKDLIQSVNVQTDVLVDSKTAFSEGMAYISYENVSDLPLYLEGRFFHSHHVIATPDQFKAEIPPHTTQTVAISLKAISPFHLKENTLLTFEGSLGYQSKAYPDLTLSGMIDLPIQPSRYPLLPTQELAFIDTAQIDIQPPLPQTTVVYTLDGRNPTAQSDPYSTPIPVTETTTIKARLLHENGWMSETVEMKAKQVKAGKGVMVKRYSYNQLGKFWGYIPDFSELTPDAVMVSKSLDPVKAAGKSDQFGLVYTGQIELPETGRYHFQVVSDDAARLLIDGKEAVSDPMKHKARKATGEIELTAGSHLLEIQYFQFKRNYALDIQYTLPSGQVKELTIDQLSITPQTH